MITLPVAPGQKEITLYDCYDVAEIVNKSHKTVRQWAFLNRVPQIGKRGYVFTDSRIEQMRGGKG